MRHDDAVKCIEYSKDLSTSTAAAPCCLPLTRPRRADSVLSAGWDSTLRITSPTDPSSSTVIQLPGKVYSLATSTTKIVAAMGGRAVWIWDARMLKDALEKKGEVEAWQKRESSLKFMTRAVRCMPNDDGESRLWRGASGVRRLIRRCGRVRDDLNRGPSRGRVLRSRFGRAGEEVRVQVPPTSHRGRRHGLPGPRTRVQRRVRLPEVPIRPDCIH